MFCCCNQPVPESSKIVDHTGETATSSMDAVGVTGPQYTKPTALPEPPQPPAPPVKEAEYAPAPVVVPVPAPTAAGAPADEPKGDFKFSFIKRGMLGINVKTTRFEISGIRSENCIALRNQELTDVDQLKIKDKVIAVNGKTDTPPVMMKQVADTPEGDEVVLTVIRPKP